MNIFRVFFIVVGMSTLAGSWYLGSQGVGGASADISDPTTGWLRVGSGPSGGGRVK